MNQAQGSANLRCSNSEAKIIHGRSSLCLPRKLTQPRTLNQEEPKGLEGGGWGVALSTDNGKAPPTPLGQGSFQELGFL